MVFLSRLPWRSGVGREIVTPVNEERFANIAWHSQQNGFGEKI